jgi:AraC-like DNA-binding protein
MVPGRGLKAQIEALAGLGVDVVALRQELGPDCAPEKLDHPDSLVPVDRFERMWAIAHRQNPREDLATALACSIPFGAFGILDYLIGSADTVGGALESLLAHIRLATYEAQLELDRSARKLRVVLRAETALSHDAGEFMIVSIVRRLSTLTGGKLQPQQLRLTRAAPQDAAGYAQWFPCPVEFDSPVSGFTLDAAATELPLLRADAELERTLRQVAAALHLGAARTPEIELALRARLRDALADGAAGQSQLARRLGMSERTLQRRLESLNRTFSEIVESFRHEESLRLLRDANCSIADVAARLGYEEQSSFTRAFRRWTGTTPAAWRRGT